MYNIYNDDERAKGIHVFFGGMVVFIVIFCSVIYFSPKKCGHHPHGPEAKTQCLMKRGKE